MYSFCFSELLILIEKKFADFFLVHWNTKKIKFSKNIKKSRYRRVAQKMYNFAPGAADHTFFDWPCIYIQYLSIYLSFLPCIHKFYRVSQGSQVYAMDASYAAVY